MIPAQTSPARLFAQLFLKGKPSEVRAQKEEPSNGRSILDQLGSEAKKLRRNASAKDNHLLDDYFSSVREREQYRGSTTWMEMPKPKVNAKQPTDISDAPGSYVVPKVKVVTGNHHNLSHHS